MIAGVLTVCGLVALGFGTGRGYLAARSAVVPLIREGDPTRTLIETTRPIHARSRVRLAVRQVLLAVVWLCVAMYGLFLLTVGLGSSA